jgi:hypothetical protein
MLTFFLFISGCRAALSCRLDCPSSPCCLGPSNVIVFVLLSFSEGNFSLSAGTESLSAGNESVPPLSAGNESVPPLSAGSESRLFILLFK